MAPLLLRLLRRDYDPGVSKGEFSEQWSHPGDVFSVLLILGGDVVGRALAQLAGSPVTPVAFSFAQHLLIVFSTELGWVAYSLTAVVSAIGENKLMPLPDCACKVVNGHSGYLRDNSSWIIGRIVRDFEGWMDEGKKDGHIRTHLKGMIKAKYDWEKADAEEKTGSSEHVQEASRAGLCVAVYRAEKASKGHPGYDLIYFLGFATSIVQLGIAAIPCGLFGDWSIVLVTGSGILLSFATGSLSQWAKEKWSCRSEPTKKTVILTKGNGSQFAIVIIGDDKGLDLEDLAAGSINQDASALYITKVATSILAALWILLLITAAGIKQNTWFLLAVGALGMLQNAFVAGCRRSPKEFGVPLTFETVIGDPKVMKTLFAVEKAYPRIGKSMLPIFFPGKLHRDEDQMWQELDDYADTLDASASEAKKRARVLESTEWVDAETACFAIIMSTWFSRGWTSLELAKSPKVKVMFKGTFIKDLLEDILAKPEGSSERHQTAAKAIVNLRNKKITNINARNEIIDERRRGSCPDGTSKAYASAKAVNNDIDDFCQDVTMDPSSLSAGRGLKYTTTPRAGISNRAFSSYDNQCVDAMRSIINGCDIPDIYGGWWANYDWGAKALQPAIDPCCGLGSLPGWNFEFFDEPDEKGAWLVTLTVAAMDDRLVIFLPGQDCEISEIFAKFPGERTANLFHSTTSGRCPLEAARARTSRIIKAPVLLGVRPRGGAYSSSITLRHVPQNTDDSAWPGFASA
ncbi:hypothetical protein V498_06700 [Pseudogymnoascus sp. VKM F-4517 (FW-2822)]|nr:hypothetical protein V498_06700 [Pseudogymnoascus sp. VKM F-4517 (FW-2822)]